MLDVARKVAALLSKSQRRQARWLLAAIFVMGLTEILAVVSIVPFMTVVTNPGAVHENKYLSVVYHWLGGGDETRMIIYFGLFYLFAVLINNSFSALTVFRLYRYIFLCGHSIAENLLNAYLHKPYEFFINRNTSDLSKNIQAEVHRVVHGVLNPGARLVTRAVVTASIVIMLLVVDIRLALSVSAFLGGLYLVLYFVFKDKLLSMGKTNTVSSQGRFKIASEALQGAKELKILGREKAYTARFTKPSREYARVESLNASIMGLPRYGLETVAVLGVILLILYLIADNKRPSEIIPLLSLYVFSGYRLLPMLQQMFGCVTDIRYHSPALDILCRDMAGWHPDTSEADGVTAPLKVNDCIELKDISYGYPGAKRKAIEHLDLAIAANTTVGLVGETGSGKTTMVDIILGLLPAEGKLSIDGLAIDPGNVRNWQAGVGYVPQDIYLSDDSVLRNIAFGIDDEKIDRGAVVEAARKANLHDFVMNELPEQYDTQLGEKGVKLSGGQRQRIGLARALYHDPSVLVLDEATSALDSVTEHSVMEEIRGINHRKTIIMIAHRLDTVRHCDQIFVLSQGQLVCRGNYEQLMDTCDMFRNMVEIQHRNDGKNIAGK